jgi:hypothetical protein
VARVSDLVLKWADRLSRQMRIGDMHRELAELSDEMRTCPADDGPKLHCLYHSMLKDMIAMSQPAFDACADELGFTVDAQGRIARAVLS